MTQALPLILLALAAGADHKPTPAEQAELARHFGFGPMQIYKVKPGIDDLNLADLDADGRTDIALWNGEQSRIELFYQPDPNAPPPAAPTLERNELPNRGPLRLENVAVTYSVADLDVGELTGDGRPDLVFFGEPRELVILPGKPDGGFGAPISQRAADANPRQGALALGDFDHDGRTDVALLGTDVLLLFRQKEGGGVAPPLRLMHGVRNPLVLQRIDLNGDGRDDLIIGADDEKYGAYVCLQEGSGTLAALRPVRVPRLRSLTAVRTPGGDELYAVEYATNRLKLFRWELPPQAGVAGDWPQRLHSYPVKSASKQRPLALGDVDGDGLTDCVSVDPDAAQMILFRGETDGLGAGTAFPCLAKTTDVQVADIDLDGRPEVITASAEEKTIGVSRYEGGRLTFPAARAARGAPYVLAIGPRRAGAAADCLAYVTREEDELKLVVGSPGPTPQEGEQTTAVADVDEDPSGLRLADVDQDGRNDLVLFIRFSAPRVFRQADDGTFAELGGAERRAGLLKEATPAGFALADVTGDGKPEVLLAQDNLARALIVRDGRWTVVDQFNPETADARLAGLAVLPGPGRPTLVLYDRKEESLLAFRPRADGTYALAHSQPIGGFALTAMQALPVGNTGPGSAARQAVLLADPGKLAVLTPDEQAPTLVEKQSYESETRDAHLADAVAGDLNHDGVRDVAAVDMAKAAIEVLTTLPGGALTRVLRFQVFQGKRFMDEPGVLGEPREVLLGDVTGDGTDDVVLIVHDRLIVYPGQ